MDVFSNVDSQEKRKEAGPIFELEINDTTDTDRSASYLDIHLEIDSAGRLRTKHYDKRLFQFSICELSIYK